MIVTASGISLSPVTAVDSIGSADGRVNDVDRSGDGLMGKQTIFHILPTAATVFSVMTAVVSAHLTQRHRFHFFES